MSLTVRRTLGLLLLLAAVAQDAVAGGPVAVGGRHAEAAEPILAVSLHEAVERDYVRVAASGSGITGVNLTVTNLTQRNLVVHVPVGTVARSDGDHQNMALVEPKTIELGAGGSVRVRVAAACMDYSRPVPGSRDGFSVDPAPGRGARLDGVLEEIAEGDYSHGAKQAAIWHVTDGMPWGQIRNVRISTSMFDLQGRAVASDAEIDEAKRLIEAAHVRSADAEEAEAREKEIRRRMRDAERKGEIRRLAGLLATVEDEGLRAEGEETLGRAVEARVRDSVRGVRRAPKNAHRARLTELARALGALEASGLSVESLPEGLRQGLSEAAAECLSPERLRIPPDVAVLVERPRVCERLLQASSVAVRCAQLGIVPREGILAPVDGVRPQVLQDLLRALSRVEGEDLVAAADLLAPWPDEKLEARERALAEAVRTLLEEEAQATLGRARELEAEGRLTEALREAEVANAATSDPGVRDQSRALHARLAEELGSLESDLDDAEEALAARDWLRAARLINRVIRADPDRTRARDLRRAHAAELGEEGLKRAVWAKNFALNGDHERALQAISDARELARGTGSRGEVAALCGEAEALTGGPGG